MTLRLVYIMYISDLEVGTKLSVELDLDGKIPATLYSEVVQAIHSKRAILIQKLVKDDKIVTFNIDGLKITTTVLTDNKPYIWRNCKIQYIKLNDKAYHAIICKETGVQLNRRSHFRVGVNEYCYVNYGKATVDALLLDVSFTGFEFIVGKWDGSEMEYVNVSYHDSLLECDVNLIGRVVRTEDKEDGKKLFGCYMIQKDDVSKYINTRQRKLIRVNVNMT